MGHFDAKPSFQSHIRHHLINRYFLYTSSENSVLNIAAIIGDTSITVIDGSVFTTGDFINIDGEHQDIFQVTVNGNVLTLDGPLNNAHSIGAIIVKVIKDISTANLTTTASLLFPIVFKINPPLDEVWHIARCVLYIEDNATMDNSKFGALSALTNGVVLRENKVTPTTLTNWKTNRDIIIDMFDVEQNDRASAGNSSLKCRWTFSKSGVLIVLDGSLNQSLDLIVQDNLTGLNSFIIRTQGHIEKI